MCLNGDWFDRARIKEEMDECLCLYMRINECIRHGLVEICPDRLRKSLLSVCADLLERPGVSLL